MTDDNLNMEIPEGQESQDDLETTGNISSNERTEKEALDQQLRQALDVSPVTDKFQALLEESRTLLIGQDQLIELMLICLMADGHILMEGVPGIAKTLSAKVFAQTLSADFNRIQFTPDLMPSDILGTSIFNLKDSKFEFKKGPIFSNIILIDEINRSPAKTQSALFQVMGEKEIDYDGINYPMSELFMVLATQNPIEQEGTYRLPEGQLDRFLMKVNLTYPTAEEELQILDRFKHKDDFKEVEGINSVLTTQDIVEARGYMEKVIVEKMVLNYIVAIIERTRNHGKLYLGASPRGSLALLTASKAAALLRGRDFVVPEDIQYMAPYILNHRIILTAEAEMQGLTTHQVIQEIISTVEVPR